MKQIHLKLVLLAVTLLMVVPICYAQQNYSTKGIKKEACYINPTSRDLDYRNMDIRIEGNRIIAYEDPFTKRFLACDVPFHKMTPQEKSQMRFIDSQGRSYEYYYGDCNSSATIGKLTIYFTVNKEDTDIPVSYPGGERSFRELCQNYPGGESALYRKLSQNIIYPTDAQEYNIQGKVIVILGVDADGIITNASIKKGVHPLLDKEALRAARLLGKFNPAIENGIAVGRSYTLPINFRISN